MSASGMFSAKLVSIVTITSFLSLPLLSCAAVAEETKSEQLTQINAPTAIAPTEPYLSAQVNSTYPDFRLPNVFTPPQSIRQVSPTRLNSTATTKRGDRPELRQIMRLDPAPFPSFAYE